MTKKITAADTTRGKLERWLNEQPLVPTSSELALQVKKVKRKIRISRDEER